MQISWTFSTAILQQLNQLVHEDNGYQFFNMGFYTKSNVEAILHISVYSICIRKPQKRQSSDKCVIVVEGALIFQFFFFREIYLFPYIFFILLWVYIVVKLNQDLLDK